MLAKKVWEIEGHQVEPPYERILKTVFTKGGEIPDFTFVAAVFKPFVGKNAVHTHEVGELMYVVSGRGKATLGNDSIDIEPDMAFFAPAGVVHQVENTGEETMKLLAFYAPAIDVSSMTPNIKK